MLVARLTFAAAVILAIAGVWWLADLLRDHLPSPPDVNRGLLTAGEGPPRVFAYLNTYLVNDDLAQLIDRLPPAGSAVNAVNPQVRTRRLLALIDILDRRHQVVRPARAADWRRVPSGAVVRAFASWPGPDSSRSAVRLRLSGGAVVTLPDRALVWSPRPGRRVVVLAQSVVHPHGTGNPELLPLAVYAG